MDKRLKKLEQYREAEGLKHSDISRLLGVKNLETYNNWRYRDSVPKSYYERIDEITAVLDDDIDSSIIEKIAQLPESKKRLAELYLDALLTEDQ